MFRKRRLTKKQIRLQQIFDSHDLVDSLNENNESTRMIINYLCDYYDGTLNRQYLDRDILTFSEAPRIVYPYKADSEGETWLSYLYVSLRLKGGSSPKLVFGIGEDGSFGATKVPMTPAATWEFTPGFDDV